MLYKHIYLPENDRKIKTQDKTKKTYRPSNWKIISGHSIVIELFI